MRPDQPNMIVHQPGCPIDAVHWLRHAIAAAGRCVSDDPAPHADRVSAMALLDTLAHLAELDNWATVSLRDVANQATLMNREPFSSMCTCGAFDHPPGGTDGA